MTPLVLTFVALTAVADADAMPRPEVWVGHQVVRGAWKLPVFGDVTTQTETFLLAQVKRQGGRVDIEQQACGVQIKENFGIRVTLPQSTLRSLPPTAIRFEPSRGQALHAEPWLVAWDTEDLDSDSAPGVTVNISTPICSGAMFVGSRSVSEADGELTEDGMRGTVSVNTKQTIHDASTFCLRAAGIDTEELQIGEFVYRRFPAETTCASLAEHPWPVRVSEREEAP